MQQCRADIPQCGVRAGSSHEVAGPSWKCGLPDCCCARAAASEMLPGLNNESVFRQARFLRCNQPAPLMLRHGQAGSQGPQLTCLLRLSGWAQHTRESVPALMQASRCNAHALQLLEPHRVPL